MLYYSASGAIVVSRGYGTLNAERVDEPKKVRIPFQLLRCCALKQDPRHHTGLCPAKRFSTTIDPLVLHADIVPIDDHAQDFKTQSRRRLDGAPACPRTRCERYPCSPALICTQVTRVPWFPRSSGHAARSGKSSTISKRDWTRQDDESRAAELEASRTAADARAVLESKLE